MLLGRSLLGEISFRGWIEWLAGISGRVMVDLTHLMTSKNSCLQEVISFRCFLVEWRGERDAGVTERERDKYQCLLFFCCFFL
jgi:hypothetical protein